MGRIDRKLYWIGLGLLLCLSALIAAVQGTSLASWPTAMGTPPAVGLALLVGGRLDDAGCSPWVGIGLTVPIVAVVSTIVDVALGAPLGAWIDHHAMRPSFALAALALLALVVAAGVPGTAPAQTDRSTA
jgi:hypothetical protein